MGFLNRLFAKREDKRYVLLSAAIQVAENGVRDVRGNEKNELAEVTRKLLVCGYPDIEIRAKLLLQKLE